MADLDTCLKLLDELYEVTLDPATWPLMFAQIRITLGEMDLDLRQLDSLGTDSGVISDSPRLDPALEYDGPTGRTTLAELLLSHVHRAMRLALRVEELALAHLAMKNVADRLLFGVCVLDAAGAVLHYNAAARQIARAGDGLEFKPEGLHLASNKARRHYEAALAAAAGNVDSMPVSPLGVITVARPSGQRHYTLWLSPIPAVAGSPAIRRAAVVVFVTDPERVAQPAPQTLAVALGLTVREAQLALALTAGDSLTQAAARLGIAHATARSYLKLIFRKTRANRQGELVRLVLSTAMALPEHGTNHRLN